MRYVKTAFILIVLAALVFVLAPGKSTNAGSAGAIRSVCIVQGRVEMTLTALGDEDDGGGLDYVGAMVFGILHSKAIPADGAYHEVEFSFDTTTADLTQPVPYCAGNMDAAGNTTAPGFSGCNYEVLETCMPEAPVPDGFTQRSLSCTAAVLDAPGGKVVGDNTVLAGQVWYVNPKPVLGLDGVSYTEIFVGGPTTGYIPTACIGGPTAFSSE